MPIDGRARTRRGRRPSAPPPPSIREEDEPALSDETEPSGPVPAGFEVASIWRRLLAYAIDLFILLIVGIVVGSLLISFGMKQVVTVSQFGAPPSRATTLSAEGALLEGLITILFRGFYFVASWLVLRGSPGQRLLALQVANFADGRTLTLGQGVIRWLALGVPFDLALTLSPNGFIGDVVSLFAFMWLAVLFITTYWSPFQQGLHDRFVGSLVLRQLPDEPLPRE